MRAPTDAALRRWGRPRQIRHPMAPLEYSQEASHTLLLDENLLSERGGGAGFDQRPRMKSRASCGRAAID